MRVAKLLGQAENVLEQSGLIDRRDHLSRELATLGRHGHEFTALGDHHPGEDTRAGGYCAARGQPLRPPPGPRRRCRWQSSPICARGPTIASQMVDPAPTAAPSSTTARSIRAPLAYRHVGPEHHVWPLRSRPSPILEPAVDQNGIHGLSSLAGPGARGQLSVRPLPSSRSKVALR